MRPARPPTCRVVIAAVAAAVVIVILLRSWRTVLRWILAIAALAVVVAVGARLLWRSATAPGGAVGRPPAAGALSDLGPVLSLLRLRAATQVHVTTHAPFAVSFLLVLLLVAIAAAVLHADHAAQTAVAAQLTAEAVNGEVTAQARRTVEAREQWAFEMTQTAVVGTSQAAGAQATATAHARATAQAQNATGTAASGLTTATARAQSATATARAADATATAQTRLDALESTSVAATAQTIERLNRREQSTQALRAYGPWGLLALALTAAGLIGWQLLPVLVARWRVIRRKAGEAEPLVMLERGPDGSQRIALPLHSFWQWFDTGPVPEPPPASSWPPWCRPPAAPSQEAAAPRPERGPEARSRRACLRHPRGRAADSAALDRGRGGAVGRRGESVKPLLGRSTRLQFYRRDAESAELYTFAGNQVASLRPR